MKGLRRRRQKGYDQGAFLTFLFNKLARWWNWGNFFVLL